MKGHGHQASMGGSVEDFMDKKNHKKEKRKEKHKIRPKKR
jgi:hypothetical protein